MNKSSVKSERAAQAVAEHIERLIFEGSLRPNERLLAERELAERLSVSRSTLRDGLKILEARGLIEGDGRGSRIAMLGHEAVSDPLVAMLARHAEGADDYLEFRGIVESAAAGLAAERATGPELERLEECLARMDRAHAAHAPAEEIEADAEMHLLIYEASHNLTLLQMMQALSGVLRADVVQNRTRLFSIPATRDLLRAQHQAIARSIIERNPVAARSAAAEHIAYIRSASRAIRAAESRLELSLRRLNGGDIAARQSPAKGITRPGSLSEQGEAT